MSLRLYEMLPWAFGANSKPWNTFRKSVGYIVFLKKCFVYTMEGRRRFFWYTGFLMHLPADNLKDPA